MDTFLALAGLFGVAFLAATVLPAQSEAALVGLQLAGYPVAVLVLVGSAGNTLGALVNWALGRGLGRYRDSRWFPVSPPALDRACDGIGGGAAGACSCRGRRSAGTR